MPVAPCFFLILVLTRFLHANRLPLRSKTLWLQLLQSAFQQFQPVLAPEDLARRQHVARRAEDARCQSLLRKLLVQRVEFGVRSSARAQLPGVETGALSGQRDRCGIS